MKRVPELRELSDDHHTGLVLAMRCRRAGRQASEPSPAEVWERVLEAFANHLEPHFRIEEEHLLPGLEAIGEESLAARIREEHRGLRALRDSALPIPTLVERFGELLEAHIRFEERQVFEATQHRLAPATLQAIESACRVVPRAGTNSREA